MTKEEIIKNRCSLYNIAGHKLYSLDGVIAAMQEYSDIQNKELTERLAEKDKQINYLTERLTEDYTEIRNLQSELTELKESKSSIYVYTDKTAELDILKKGNEIEKLIKQVNTLNNKISELKDKHKMDVERAFGSGYDAGGDIEFWNGKGEFIRKRSEQYYKETHEND